MFSEIIAEFNVVSLNNSYKRPLHTWVSHLVSTDGEHDIVRLEQEEINPEDENAVVILTRSDFEWIYRQLKGH